MSSIAFLGAGNIAQAIMGGLTRNGFEPGKLRVYDPVAACRERAAALGAHIATDNRAAIDGADTVLVCVKPDVVPTLLDSISSAVTGQLFVSVAAGVTSQSLLSRLPAGTALIRCMPNTPALIQAGMTAMFATAGVTEEQRAAADRILSAAGETLWLHDEDDLDAVTAVSGSGPAYFFLLMEAMIAAGIEQGLSPEVARKLVLQTALGAAQMALEHADDPGVLRRRVTSPGGTTAAALACFEANDFPRLIAGAIGAARDRAVELSGS